MTTARSQKTGTFEEFLLGNLHEPASTCKSIVLKVQNDSGENVNTMLIDRIIKVFVPFSENN